MRIPAEVKKRARFQVGEKLYNLRGEGLRSVELCGLWLWADCLSEKDELILLRHGFFQAKGRFAWAPEEILDYTSSNKKRVKMAYIQKKYGRDIIKLEELTK